MVNKLHNLNQNFIQKQIKTLNLSYTEFKEKFNEKYSKYKLCSFNLTRFNDQWTHSIYYGKQQQMYTDNLPILADTLDCNILDLLSVRQDLLSIEPTGNKPITKLNVEFIQKQIKFYSLTRAEFYYLFECRYQETFKMSPQYYLVDRLYEGKQKSLYSKTLPVLCSVLNCTEKDITYIEPLQDINDSLVQDVKQLKLQFEEFINKYS
jgi:DNA-binding Xre family transcriptional regulator